MGQREDKEDANDAAQTSLGATRRGVTSARHTETMALTLAYVGGGVGSFIPSHNEAITGELGMLINFYELNTSPHTPGRSL